MIQNCNNGKQTERGGKVKAKRIKTKSYKKNEGEKVNARED